MRGMATAALGLTIATWERRRGNSDRDDTGTRPPEQGMVPAMARSARITCVVLAGVAAALLAGAVPCQAGPGPATTCRGT